ncbi:MAG: DUF4417 domain-containing protein [Clostridiales bacterium]|jgi:hypothetical protein|nr:DUF4417 domain-containing protein [Clostridiales bacterium]
MKNYHENPRLDVFKSNLVKDAYFSRALEFPLLSKTEFKPERAIPFDKALKVTDYNQWVHFYIHDYCFERIWNNPKQYLEMLKKFAGVITPDFSIYRELPLVMQMWNTYRNRAIGYWLQSNGVNIIPNVRWGDERTYDFAFEGIAQGGTVAISTNGCIQKKIDRDYFIDGLAEMVKILKPDTIVNYSYTPDHVFTRYKEQGIEIVQIENYALTVRKAVK